jgi:hypothetical protein
VLPNLLKFFTQSDEALTYLLTLNFTSYLQLKSLCSPVQEPLIANCPDSNNSVPVLRPNFVKLTVITLCYLCLLLPSCLFPSLYPIKFCMHFQLALSRWVLCPHHLRLLHHTTLIFKNLKLWSCSLHSFLILLHFSQAQMFFLPPSFQCTWMSARYICNLKTSDLRFSELGKINIKFFRFWHCEFGREVKSLEERAEKSILR